MFHRALSGRTLGARKDEAQTENKVMALLEVRNLNVQVDDREILHGLSLTVNEGEVHAIMGPNGSGK